MALKYRITILPIRKAEKPDTKGANAIEFTNRGDAVAIVSGERLEQNQTISISGHAGEIDETLYDVKFINTGGQEQLLYCKVKRYTNE